MKVLIVNNMVPFVWGGAEELAVHLKKHVQLLGHEAEILRIPFSWEPNDRILSQMLMVRSLELSNVDMVLALKFPAYLIRHPRKTIWLVHQFRQAYDLLEVGQSSLVGEQGAQVRSAIRAADNEAFQESQRIYAISETTRKRLQKYNGFDARLLPTPVNDPELFVGGPYEDYIFAGGRINSLKRQDLLIEALARTNSNVRLVIAGPPDQESDRNHLQSLVERFGLQDRVKLDIRFLKREDYVRYVNHAAAVACIPYDEESMSYVGMEAAMARKPLITTTDSGGVTELVIPGETGWMVKPNADELARAMNTVYKRQSWLPKLGANLRSHFESFEINWPSTVETLLR